MKDRKFFLDYQNPKLVLAVIIFFITALLFLWEIVGYFSAKQELVLPKEIIRANSKENIQINSPVFRTALFGDYVPVNLSDNEIKQSMLDAEVVGVLFSSQAENSQVIIRAGGGPEKIYSIGDSLPGGAVIKRISQNGVVVLHNGALESLSLPKNELIFDAPAKPLVEE
ncbi:type II secretion system protein N [Legionella jordanis]|uniref:General secretion pathway protein C n=1 Tax=Legionella jordanis TaxID=456 RepID=A0A0W0V850_9GAMM|nr:type II secretion system protein N [Legionella jordanis]KTD16299.1 general secretion pathway protein C [Legionella jordanis]RMX04487.1 general secretion pathway protein GspC [Legionella jordanis]VEH12243.1 general secretion pathway protein C [Legionella jordanis]HAT8713453.1 general secretion pathway protein GspC [Legionella jordanis]